MARHYFHTREPFRLPDDTLEAIAEILVGTDDDLFVAMAEIGIDTDEGDIVSLAGELPGLPVQQCPDCGYWHRGRACRDCREKVKTP